MVPHSDSEPASSQRYVPQRRYRHVKPVPAAILNQCMVCFEEGLYSQSLSLLSSVLTAGQDTSRPAGVPPTQYLSFISTLVVHPFLTTRTTSADKQKAANDAFHYLISLCEVAGSHASGLDTGLQFSAAQADSRSKRAKSRKSELVSDSEDDAAGRIRSKFAESQSLWSTANDFWSVVGWAFNCSVAHKARWDRWQHWLHLMLLVLENDMDARLCDAANGSGPTPSDALEDCMLAQYLSVIGAGRNNKRRILRAILADGQSKALAEFSEIWKGETKPPKDKQDATDRKRKRLDLEHEEYGDYDDDESDASDTPLNSKRTSRSVSRLSGAKRSRAATEDPEERGSMESEDLEENISPIEAYGGTESISLRQRFLSLLARFCAANTNVLSDLEDLLDLYTEFLKPLPLVVFQNFVQPRKRYLDLHTQSSLDQTMLRRLLVGTAPVYNENSLTQEDFETHFAPFPANSAAVVEHAKLSLLVEDLLRLLWQSGRLTYRESIVQAVEEGIEARRDRAILDGRKKTGARAKEDEEAWTVLQVSGENMLALLELLKDR